MRLHLWSVVSFLAILCSVNEAYKVLPGLGKLHRIVTSTRDLTTPRSLVNDARKYFFSHGLLRRHRDVSKLQAVETASTSVESRPEKFQALHAIPSTYVTLPTAQSALQHWATEQVHTGPAMNVEMLSNGMRFVFPSSPKSFLTFILTSTPSLQTHNDLVLSAAMYIDHESSHPVQSLLNSLMSHLVESAVLELQSLATERAPIAVHTVTDAQAQIHVIPPRKVSEMEERREDQRAYLYEKSFLDHLPPTSTEKEESIEEEAEDVEIAGGYDDDEEDVGIDEQELSDQLQWQRQPLTIEEADAMQHLEEHGELPNHQLQASNSNDNSYEFTLGYYENILHSWSSYRPSSALRQYLIQAVQQLGAQFAQLAPFGITTTHTSRGIALQFDIIDDDLQMIIEVQQHNEVHNQAFFVRLVYADVTSQAFLSLDQLGTDLQLMLQSLEQKLQYAIQRVVIPMQYEEQYESVLPHEGEDVVVEDNVEDAAEIVHTADLAQPQLEAETDLAQPQLEAEADLAQPQLEAEADLAQAQLEAEADLAQAQLEAETDLQLESEAEDEQLKEDLRNDEEHGKGGDEEESALEQMLQEQFKRISPSFLKEGFVSDRIEDSLLHGNPIDYLSDVPPPATVGNTDDHNNNNNNNININQDQIPFPEIMSTTASKTASNAASSNAGNAADRLHHRSSSSSSSSSMLTTDKPKSIQEQAVDELNKILARSKGSSGLYSIIEQVQKQETSIAQLAFDTHNHNHSTAMLPVEDAEGVITNLQELFQLGMNATAMQSRDLYDSITPYQLLQTINEYVRQRRMTIDNDMLRQIGGNTLHINTTTTSTNPTNPTSIGNTGAKNIFQRIQDFLSNSNATTETTSSRTMASNAQTLSKSWALQNYQIDRLVEELERINNLNLGGAIERNVLDSYRDLLLSEDFLALMQSRNSQETHPLRRQCYAKLIEASLFLHHELLLLLHQEQLKYLELVEQICHIAKTYQHDELQFLTQMDRLKNQFTTDFYRFMNYLVDQEEQKVIRDYLQKQQLLGMSSAQNAVVDQGTRERILRQHLVKPNWLAVLLIVRQGIEAELLQRFDYSLECLWVVIRFDSTELRTAVLAEFVQMTPATELPYLRELGMNMIGNIEQQLAKYELPHGFGYDLERMPSDLQAMLTFDADLPPRLTLFRAELDQYLSESYIQERLQTHAIEANAQGMELMLSYRNPVTQEEILAQEARAKEQALHGSSQESANNMLFTEGTTYLAQADEATGGENGSKPFVSRLPGGVKVQAIDSFDHSTEQQES